MSLKRAIVGAVVVVVCIAVWDYSRVRRSTTSLRGRVHCVSNLKQIGLAFRSQRNDLSASFVLTGSVTVARSQDD